METKRKFSTQKTFFSVFTNPNLYNNSLSPWFITGFTDAEGSFIASIRRNSNQKIGWRVEPRFSISLHVKDKGILELIKLYFGGIGNITKHNLNSVQYQVTCLKDLINVIIPHFDKYSLITQKHADFELFKAVVLMLSRKEHLTVEGLHKIVAIRATLNWGLSPELKTSFPNITPIQKPLVEIGVIKDCDWLAGFASGEGCFFINIQKSFTRNIGETVNLCFLISQNSKDEQLINSIVSFFGGKVYKRSNKPIVEFIVTKYSDLTEKVIPFFEKYKIKGVKSRDFEDFKKVAELMKAKVHLTKEKLEEIRQIKMGMNKARGPAV